MSRSITNKSTNKPRILLVGDSRDGLKKLRTGIRPEDFEIRCVCSIKELNGACNEKHDIVAVDVPPPTMIETLKLIRTSRKHRNTPLFVESRATEDNVNMAGVFPKYRAMPCNHRELLSLLQTSLSIRGHKETKAQRVL